MNLTFTFELCYNVNVDVRDLALMSYENPTTRQRVKLSKKALAAFFSFSLDFLRFCAILCLEIQIGHLVDVLW